LTETVFPVSTTVRARFRDTDAMGHVNNAVYSSYLEEARVVYWRELTGLEDFTKVDLILAKVEINYRSPAFVGEAMTVNIRLSRIGGSSFDFEYRIIDKKTDRLVVEATSTQCLYDYEKGRVKRIPADLKEKIATLEARG